MDGLFDWGMTKGKIWVATHRLNIVGALCASKKVYRIYVRPSYRMMGVGSHLLSAHEVATYAMVPEKNIDALKFFKAVGFTKSELFPGKFDDCDGIRMEMP